MFWCLIKHRAHTRKQAILPFLAYKMYILILRVICSQINWGKFDEKHLSGDKVRVSIDELDLGGVSALQTFSTEFSRSLDNFSSYCLKFS